MKYKMKKSLLAVILSPLVLCFMANATAPFPVENDYKDFTYTLVEKTYREDETGEEPYTYLEYEITNTGAYYCDHFYVQLSKKDQFGLIAVDYTVDGLFDKSNEMIYGGPVLGPGATNHFCCGVTNKRPEEIKDTLKVCCKGYTAVAETFVLNDASLSFVEETTAPKYRYIYKANFDYSYSSNEKNNCLCFTVSYESKDYYFSSRYFNEENHPRLSEVELETKEELNLDEVSISNVMIVKARSRGGGGAILLLIPFLVGGVFLIAMGIALIVGIVIIVVSIVKSKKKQKLTMSDINK